jgi:uncharacterized protein
MSLQWPWFSVLGTIVLPALGHLYHFILAVNVSHGLGFRQRVLDRLRAGLLAGLVATSAFLLWKHLQHPWWTWDWPLRGYVVLCVLSGGIIGPMASLRLAVRKQPSGIAGRSQLYDLAATSGFEALIGQGKYSCQLRLPGNESFQLRRRDWELEFAGLPDALEGLSIVQLSDLHFAPCFQRRFFERVIETCRDWQADLIVITGDLIDDDETIAWIDPVLTPLEARLGKYAILGNHDNEHQPDRILDALAGAGFESLEGRWITFAAEGATLALGGTSAPWGPAFEPGDIPQADFRVLLSHSPDLFYRACRWEIDLMLSGHNHGGQIRLPLLGPVLMPSRYSRRFDRGFFRHGLTLMYVSEGVAGKHPARYGCPPEVCRFVLRSTNDNKPDF